MMLMAARAQTWDRNTQQDTAGGLEAGEPGRVYSQYAKGHDPATAGPARIGFMGIRAPVALERVWGSLFMPRLPGQPAKVIASRPESIRGGQPAVQKIKPASNLTPVLSVEASAPWYEFVQN